MQYIYRMSFKLNETALKQILLKDLKNILRISLIISLFINIRLSILRCIDKLKMKVLFSTIILMWYVLQVRFNKFEICTRPKFLSPNKLALPYTFCFYSSFGRLPRTCNYMHIIHVLVRNQFQKKTGLVMCILNYLF